MEERDVALLRGGPAPGVLSDNPILGLRGAARWATHYDEFLAELDIVRPATEDRRLSLLLPYVRDANQLAAAVRQIRGAGITCRLGSMIETPSAVVDASAIMKIVDFAVIGTNDLTTLTLGCGRQADGYSTAHPAVVGQIRSVLAAAAAVGKPAKVAGNFDTFLLDTLGECDADTFVIHYSDWRDLVPHSPREYRDRQLALALRRESDARLVEAGLLDGANAVAVSGMLRRSTPDQRPPAIQEG